MAWAEHARYDEGMSDDPVLDQIRRLVASIKIEPVVVYGDTSQLEDLSRAGRTARRKKVVITSRRR